MQSDERPGRKRIPDRIRDVVAARQNGLCKCGCGMPIGKGIQWDHEPSLALRDVNAAGTDYVPPQHHPDYIDARCPRSHRIKTSGFGGASSTAGTDIGKIKKARKRGKPPKRKCRWPTRSIQSRQFPKRHRPMRSGK